MLTIILSDLKITLRGDFLSKLQHFGFLIGIIKI